MISSNAPDIFELNNACLAPSAELRSSLIDPMIDDFSLLNKFVNNLESIDSIINIVNKDDNINKSYILYNKFKLNYIECFILNFLKIAFASNKSVFSHF